MERDASADGSSSSLPESDHIIGGLSPSNDEKIVSGHRKAALRDRTRNASRRLSVELRNNGSIKTWWADLIQQPKCFSGSTRCGYGRDLSVGDVDWDNDDESDTSECDSLLKNGEVEESPLFIWNFWSTAAGALIVSYLVLGSIVYMGLEGWDPKESIYFVVVTISTVGYGDLYPETDAGKIFTIFYAIVGIVIVFRLIAWLMGRILDKHEDFLVKVVNQEVGLYTAEQIHEQRSSELRKRWRNTCVFSLVMIFLYIFVGTFYWVHWHKMPLVTVLYFVMTTITTIGYGDISPHEMEHGALLFSIFYVTTGVCVLSYVFSKLAEIQLEYLQNEKRGQVLLQRLSRKRLRQMMKGAVESSRENLSQSGVEGTEGTVLSMSWGSFLSIMLVEMELADKNLIVEIRERYEELMEQERKRQSRKRLPVVDEANVVTV